jgi:hypothetical protein
VGDAASAASNRTAELADRAREVSDGVAEKARAVSVMAGAAFETAKRPFTRAPECDERAVEGALEVMHRDSEAACAVEAAAHEHR